MRDRPSLAPTPARASEDAYFTLPRAVSDGGVDSAAYATDLMRVAKGHLRDASREGPLGRLIAAEIADLPEISRSALSQNLQTAELARYSVAR